MARPTTIPSWATAITPSTPSAGTLQTGAVAGQAANPTDSNWVWKYTSEWATYVSEISPSDRVLDVDLVRSTSSGAGVTPTALSLTGSQTAIQGSNGTTSTVWTLLAAGATFTYDAGSGASTFLTFAPAIGWYVQNTGLLVLGDTADDGFRFGYSTSTGSATPLVLKYYLSDGSGGWTINSTALTNLGITYTGGLLELRYPTGGGSKSFYRDLSGVLTGDNSAARLSGGLGFTMRIVGMGATLDASTAGSDIIVKLIAQSRATGTETDILELPSSGTPHTGGSTALTDTGAHSVDLNANRYYIRAETAGTTGNMVSIKDLYITIDKYAVE